MKKILFIFVSLSLLAFASCSKDDDVVEQQGVGSVSNDLDMSNKTFSDSTTTIIFGSNCVGRATISIDVDTAIITVNFPFTYPAKLAIDYVGTLASVNITIGTEGMEVDPLSEQERVEEILQDKICTIYDMSHNTLRFTLKISQEKSINYSLALGKQVI